MPRLAEFFSGRLAQCAAAIASGIALTTAYPPHNASLVVWFWMIPLLIALWSGGKTRTLECRAVELQGEGAPSPRVAGAGGGPAPCERPRIGSGFFLGYLAGLSFFIPNLAWLRHSSRVINGAIDERWLGWPAELLGWGAVLGMCLFLSLYWGVWGAFAATLGRPRTQSGGGPLFSASLESLRAAFLNASLWAGLEWARGIVLTGFGWNGLAVPLISELALVQSAEIVGVSGLSFLPVFCVCVMLNTTVRFREEVRTSRVRPHLDFFCAVALVLLDFLYGYRVLSAPAPKEIVPLRVLLVQQNISQQMKWSHEYDEVIYHGYERYTLPFADRVDLVIWPESALPLPFQHPAHQPFLNELLSRGDFSLLAGADLVEEGQLRYTGAALMRGADKHQLYRKIQLVPFGEFLPLRSFPFVEKLLGGILPGDFERGDSTEPLVLVKPAGVQIIPLICFEDTFGRLARKFVRDAPQLLVNCTNDGWFLHSAENEQHLANARFRCIELRRPMARAANTGVTCLVDAQGRVFPGDRLVNKDTGSVFTEGALFREIKLEKNPPRTFYARYGDACSVALLVISGCTAVLAMWRKMGDASRFTHTGRSERGGNG